MTTQASYQSTNDYVLRRNYAASARLNLQHYQHKQCLSYLLHPSIPMREGIRIADVATGTGVWLLDLATSSPANCTFEGWDISDAQFPHKSSLPDNVKFGTFDVTAGVPEELVGRYDVVHVGLLALVIKDGNPGPWVENLGKMLKPGGHLQWMEGDLPRYIARIRTQGSDPATHPQMYALEQLHVSQMEKAASAGSIQWITDLNEHFDAGGLQNVHKFVYEVDRLYWRSWTETLLLILEEMAFRMNEPKLKVMIENAGEELVSGAVNPTLMPIVVVGQKPL